MFTNLMDKLGPQQAVSAMHSHYREVYYKTGKKIGSSDALAESLDSLDYNVLPYFASCISSRQEGLPIRSMRWTSR